MLSLCLEFGSDFTQNVLVKLGFFFLALRKILFIKIKSRGKCKDILNSSLKWSNLFKNAHTEDACGAFSSLVVPNLFSIRDWFHGRQFFVFYEGGSGEGFIRN